MDIAERALLVNITVRVWTGEKRKRPSPAKSATWKAPRRDQAFLLPPDLKAWLPEDDLAHFVVAAVGRAPLGTFEVPGRTGGKPQYHPRLMLALLVYA